VIWEVDIDAESATEAAQEARAVQLRPDTSATVFDVWEHAVGKMHRIDVAGNADSLRRAELTELRAGLRLLQCTPGLPAGIQQIAAVMLIFLDREEMFFKGSGHRSNRMVPPLDRPAGRTEKGVDKNSHIHKERAVLNIAKVILDVLVDREGPVGAQLP
jgi:hypothetical protein